MPPSNGPGTHTAQDPPVLSGPHPRHTGLALRRRRLTEMVHTALAIVCPHQVTPVVEARTVPAPDGHPGCLDGAIFYVLPRRVGLTTPEDAS